MIKNPFKVSKPCLNSCQKVGELNPFLCIHHHIYKAQYKTFPLLNICTVLYNLSRLYTHISLAPGKALMLQVRWTTKAATHVIQILSIPIH